MPKEIVRGSEPISDEEEGLVQVGWQGDLEYVQIGTLSRHVSSFVTVRDGFFVNLDRRGINDLIRNLRRARDQAFGRDE